MNDSNEAVVDVMERSIRKAEEFYAKFALIQNSVNVKKTLRNDFGGFNYRSIDLIVAEVKPKFKANHWHVEPSEEVVNVGKYNYVKATVTIWDVTRTHSVSATSWAREIEQKSKMDESQLTGVATTYARKNAWTALLNIGDADSDAIPGEFIDEKQVSIIKSLIKEIKKLGKPFDDVRFLNAFKAESIEEISVEDYSTCFDQLTIKRTAENKK